MDGRPFFNLEEGPAMTGLDIGGLLRTNHKQKIIFSRE